MKKGVQETLKQSTTIRQFILPILTSMAARSKIVLKTSKRNTITKK